MTSETKMTTSLVPYLFFGGRCEEALEFYESAAGAERGMLLRFNESPEPIPEGMLQPGFESKVMHAEMSIGGHSVFASDGCDQASSFDGFRLALSVPTKQDAERIFSALSQGGTVDMPLGETFFSPCYGQLTDKFGVGWMVMVPGEQS